MVKKQAQNGTNGLSLSGQIKNYWLEKRELIYVDAAKDQLGKADDARIQRIKYYCSKITPQLEAEGYFVYPVQDGLKTIGRRIAEPGKNGTQQLACSKTTIRSIKMALGFGRSAARKVKNGRDQRLLAPEVLEALPGVKRRVSKTH